MEKNAGEQKLRRELSLVQMIAMAAGAVIGGWIAEVPYWFELSGAGSAFLFPLLAILLIPVALAFSELTAMLPITSAVDVWSTTAFGHKVGWITQWMMYLVQVTAPALMVFIFITATQYILPIPDSMFKPLAIGIILIWFIISNYNIGFLGKLSEWLFWAMIVISLAVSVGFFISGKWSMTNITNHGGFFPKGWSGVGIALAMFSVKYIGFEMTPTLVQEIKFPVKKFPIVVLGSIFIPAILYSIVVMGVGGMHPWDGIAAMKAAEPEVIAIYGLSKTLAYGAVIAAILHALTTIITFWASSARVTYGAAQLNQLPKAFMRLNKHGQPYVSNIAVLILSLFFVFGTGSNWVQYIYTLCNIGAGTVYLVCSAAAMALRKKHPEWERPYKAPGGTFTFVCGMIISAWIIIGSALEMDLTGFISFAIFCAVGVLLFIGMSVYRKNNPGKIELIEFSPDNLEHFH